MKISYMVRLGAVPFLLALPLASALAQLASPPRIELSLAYAQSGPSNGTLGSQQVWSPTTFGLALHDRVLPHLLLGVDAGYWHATQDGQSSSVDFALVSTRVYIPGGQGLSFMLGFGVLHGDYGAFQRAPTVTGTLTRPAIGLGVGYEPIGLGVAGATRVGIFARVVNSLESSPQFSSAGPNPTNTPSAVLSQLGVSIAWH